MQPKKQEFYKHINGQFILHSRLRATKQEGNHNPTSPISNVHRKVVHLIDHRFTRIKLNRINCTKIYRLVFSIHFVQTPEFSAQPLDALYRCDLGRVWLVLKWLLEFTCIATLRRSCKVSRVSHRSKLHGGRSTCGVEGQHSLTHRFSPDLSSGSFQLALKEK